AITSKILGFIREVAIAAFFGASYLVDAYLVASIIPRLLFGVISEAITTTIIPLITEYKVKLGQKSVTELINSITTILVLVSVLIILLGEFFAHYLVYFIAPGFEGEAIDITIKMTRVMLPMIIFLGLSGLAAGMLQSQKRFLFPSFIGIPANGFLILFLFVFTKSWGVMALAIGTVIGLIAQWLFMSYDIRKLDFQFKPQISLNHPGLRKMGLLILPVIIGKGAADINILVDRMLASSLVEGSIAALNYSTRIYLLIDTILALSLAKALFPELSEMAIVNDMKGYVNSLKKSLIGLSIIVFPFSVGLIILREPIIRLVYERGAFDVTATALTAFALLFYTLGLPALSLRQVVLRAYYALQDTRTPMIIGLLTVVINIVLNLILIRYLDHGGLALATSIATTTGFLLLIWHLRKKVGSIGGMSMIISGAKIMTASLIMGFVVYYLQIYVGGLGILSGTISDIVLLLTCGSLGAVLYFIIIKLLKIEEFDWVWRKIVGRFAK
ncbi:MAG: murein biosynthesis integral membrane protein MurJ, partial [Syntrophomonadaceae bacterium]